LTFFHENDVVGVESCLYLCDKVISRCIKEGTYLLYVLKPIKRCICNQCTIFCNNMRILETLDVSFCREKWMPIYRMKR